MLAEPSGSRQSVAKNPAMIEKVRGLPKGPSPAVGPELDYNLHLAFGSALILL